MRPKKPSAIIMELVHEIDLKEAGRSTSGQVTEKMMELSSAISEMERELTSLRMKGGW